MDGREPRLHGARVLLVEDEYRLMDDLHDALHEAGAGVVGPVATLPALLTLLEGHPAIDAAILDINLRGESVFAGADVLVARGIPFVLATGYDADMIPERFDAVPRCQKPIEAAAVMHALALLIADGRTGDAA